RSSGYWIVTVFTKSMLRIVIQRPFKTSKIYRFWSALTSRLTSIVHQTFFKNQLPGPLQNFQIDQQSSYENIHKRQGQKDLPSQVHQLVVPESRDSPPDPDVEPHKEGDLYGER